MKRLKTAHLLVITAMMFGSATPALAGDVAAGRAKSGICVNCHGSQGIAGPATNYPNLAGQNERYLVAALKAYKEGQRTGGLANMMRAYALMLSEEDIENIAAYYASLK